MNLRLRIVNTTPAARLSTLRIRLSSLSTGTHAPFLATSDAGGNSYYLIQ